jgi:hypothetical protein
MLMHFIYKILFVFENQILLPLVQFEVEKLNIDKIEDLDFN